MRNSPDGQLCSVPQEKNSAQAVTAAPALIHAEKYPGADYSHICILLTVKHFEVTIVHRRLRTPLGLQWPVTVE